MKVSSVRIEMDFAGIGDLLASAEVQADIDRRAEAVADAARNRGVTVESDNVPVPVVVTSAGKKRARALVTLDHPAGLAVEAKHRLLVGSLDAARHA
jgi:hypothetical protein